MRCRDGPLPMLSNEHSLSANHTSDTSKRVSEMVSATRQPPVKHLSRVVYAEMSSSAGLAVAGDATYRARSRRFSRVDTGGRGVRPVAGSRLNPRRVLTQRGKDSPVRCSPQKIHFPQSRPICGGKQIWRCATATGAATAPPRSCRIVPENQYPPHVVATNTPDVSSSRNKLRHAHHARSRSRADEYPRVDRRHRVITVIVGEIR